MSGALLLDRRRSNTSRTLPIAVASTNSEKFEKLLESKFSSNNDGHSSTLTPLKKKKKNENQISSKIWHDSL